MGSKCSDRHLKIVYQVRDNTEGETVFYDYIQVSVMFQNGVKKQENLWKKCMDMNISAKRVQLG